MFKSLFSIFVLLFALSAHAQVSSTYQRLEDATTTNVKDLTNTSTQWTVPSLQSYYRICAFGHTAYLLCGDNPTVTSSDTGHSMVIPEGTCLGPVMLKCADETWVSCTASESTDKVSKTAHNLANGTKIQFRGVAAASGISAYTPYYVINTAANDFEISTTVGGSKLNILADVAAGAYSMMTLDSKCAPRKCAYIAPATVTGARIEFLQIAPSQK